jgi:hypothetical protein
MDVGNSLWGQDGAALQSEFLGPIATHSIDCCLPSCLFVERREAIFLEPDVLDRAIVSAHIRFASALGLLGRTRLDLVRARDTRQRISNSCGFAQLSKRAASKFKVLWVKFD